jgi:hypothetical protein
MSIGKTGEAVKHPTILFLPVHQRRSLLQPHLCISEGNNSRAGCETTHHARPAQETAQETIYATYITNEIAWVFEARRKRATASNLHSPLEGIG